MTAPLPAERAIRGYLLVGLALFTLLVGGIGGIAAIVELSGAVIAHGVFVVDSYVKKVQHQTGGTIGAIAVQEGDQVKAGQVLIRLDDTQTRANLAIVTKRLDEFSARRARLEAEREGRDAVTFPAELTERAAESAVAALMGGETRLFELRNSARLGKKAQLESRIGQLEKERLGLSVQETSKVQEIGIINRELEGVRSLWEKRLVSLQRITMEERDAARLEGERGQLVAAQAQNAGRIAEIRLQIISLDQDQRSDVAKELREIEGQTGELLERKVAAEDQLRRVEIRAPQDGVVHELTVHTVGGVVAPGEAIMMIVPVSDALRVEARIAPQDIDQVQRGQKAGLRLSAFNQRVTPEVIAVVDEISPDATTDQKTGATYYTARLRIEEEELKRLGDLKIVPGMPAEAFIQTSSRTILSYLVKPLQDQIERAFRED
ncbi:HlyD family type I secretion periplasmic adaptor subunit [Labrys wisconsinensis]|uniref:Membrane fusion protein (MFP) family protein n=1 Tax=Labrys wisconsinensis TaxID=425677 RepID=A0ABU0J744_9HYPH|nr:HlyD family type I secretion periplasmic adaptor subunit [Labrys wisconsinensis]MDQ0469455.1 HlyD family secretion protein [Labrys wisconsinensis]